MKYWKRIAAFLTAGALVLGLAAFGPAETAKASEAEDAAGETADEAAETAEDTGTVKQDIVEYFWEIPEDASLEEAMQLENRNFRIARSLEPLYDEDTYDAYKTAVSNMQRYGDQESYDAAVEARENLIQTSSMEDRVWFLWDDEGPVMDGESFTEEELDASQEDAYGYQPFIIKYLLDDPSEAKGNIVAVSGGGFTGRSNRSEGYPAAEVFNDLGYNVFLVQRRVDPYSEMDIYMDYQRAVRMVRYYAEQEGYGGTDMIAGVGWSGGGATLMGEINYCYGDLTPADEGVSGYVPDKIDAVNSDLDVAMVIYGARELDTENDNLPAFYICVGSEDSAEGVERSNVLYDQVKDEVPAMLHIMEGAGHSFGVGISPGANLTDECALWPAEADDFMQENRGHSGNVENVSDELDKTVNEASVDKVSPDEVLAYLKEKFDEMEISYYSENWGYDVADGLTKYHGNFFSEGFFDAFDIDGKQLVKDAEQELKEDVADHFGLNDETFTVNIMILTDDGFIYN